jgi:hypothetical protein
MNFTEHQVEQYEMFAEILEGFQYSKEGIQGKFLMLILNIESLLPTSNIFDYVVKTDEKKDEKFTLQTTRKSDFEEIELLTKQMEDIGGRIKELYTNIENTNYALSELENYIEESEWKIEVDSHEEMTFNEIKQKLIIEKKLNYGNI